MSLHRQARALVVGLAVVCAGCADDADGADAVRRAPGTSSPPESSAMTATTTTVVSATTTLALTTTSPTPPTPTAPPVTKPLTTAPPSPLLDEVVAAYDAAWEDFLGAASIPDETDARLDAHMAGGQLEKWRELIRGARRDGIVTRVVPGRAWRRVEQLNQLSPTEAAIVVCRFDAREDVSPTGQVVGTSTRPYRYLESFELIEGAWRWTGREWIDQVADVSDCAPPSP